MAVGQDLGDKGQSEVDVNWELYVSKKFHIKYPSDWDMDESGGMGLSLLLFSPLKSAEDDFKENVNVLIQDLSAYNINLDEFTKISEEQIKTLATNSEIILSERVKTEKGEFHKIIYTAQYGVYHLKQEQYYWINKNEAFIVTLSCEIDEFENYKLTGEKILESFNLVN